MRLPLIFAVAAIFAVPSLAAPKKLVQPKEMPTGRPFSPGILANNTLYIAGQTGSDLKTGKYPESFEDEVKQTFENINLVLKEAGMTFDNAVAVQVYLTDMELFQRMNAVYITYFREPRPGAHHRGCRQTGRFRAYRDYGHGQQMSEVNQVPLVFDAHLDLSMNALEWNRDFRLPLVEIRRRELGLQDRPDRTRGVVCLPEMRAGRIGVCVATQIARYSGRFSKLPGWSSPEQAWAQTQGQLAWYRAMEECGEMVQLRTWPEVEAHAALWRNATPEQTRTLPIGYLLSLEGADSILSWRSSGEIAPGRTDCDRACALRARDLRARHR